MTKSVTIRARVEPAIKEKAEELNLDVEKYIKLSIKTIEKDLNKKIENLKNSLDLKNKELFEQDLEKMVEKLEVIYIGMVEAVNDLSKESENIVESEIDDLKENINEFKNKISEIFKEKLKFIQNEDNLKNAKETIIKLSEEAREKLEEISLKAAKIAKGAINGLIEGAKKALEEEKKKNATEKND